MPQRYLVLFKLKEIPPCGCPDDRDFVAEFATQAEATSRLNSAINDHVKEAQEQFDNYGIMGNEHSVHPRSVPRYGRIYTDDGALGEPLPELEDLLECHANVVLCADCHDLDHEDQMEVLDHIDRYPGSMCEYVLGGELGVLSLKLSSFEFRQRRQPAPDHRELSRAALKSLVDQGVVSKYGRWYWHIPIRYKAILHALGFLEQVHLDGVRPEVISNELQRDVEEVRAGLNWLVEVRLVASLGEAYCLTFLANT
jgi:hypothetical protein